MRREEDVRGMGGERGDDERREITSLEEWRKRRERKKNLREKTKKKKKETRYQVR